LQTSTNEMLQIHLPRKAENPSQALDRLIELTNLAEGVG